MSDILAASAIEPTATGSRPFGGLREDIRVDNLTFAHHGAARPALSDVSFRIPATGMLAIVGPSGAGKSTLLDILLRFHEPQHGTLWIDGAPLQEIEPKSWRSSIAVVSQDPYIFDDTIRANILYGRPDASDVELAKAAQLVRADEFIRELPRGYDTVVGERGTQISGGQRQRSLPRPYPRPRHPDSGRGHQRSRHRDRGRDRRSPEGFAQTHAVIVVAHKLTMIHKAHHVVVLDGGRESCSKRIPYASQRRRLLCPHVPPPAHVDRSNRMKIALRRYAATSVEALMDGCHACGAVGQGSQLLDCGQ